MIEHTPTRIAHVYLGKSPPRVALFFTFFYAAPASYTLKDAVPPLHRPPTPDPTMTDDKLAQRASQLAADLPAASYTISAGYTPSGANVSAYLSAGVLSWSHNLGSSSCTRARALELLHELRGYLSALRAADSAFDALCAAATPRFELFVSSGHMDFTVAEWDGEGEIVWHYALD